MPQSHLRRTGQGWTFLVLCFTWPETLAVLQEDLRSSTSSQGCRGRATREAVELERRWDGDREDRDNEVTDLGDVKQAPSTPFLLPVVLEIPFFQTLSGLFSVSFHG